MKKILVETKQIYNVADLQCSYLPICYYEIKRKGTIHAILYPYWSNRLGNEEETMRLSWQYTRYTLTGRTNGGAVVVRRESSM